MNNHQKPRLFRKSRSSSRTSKKKRSKLGGWMIFLFFVLIIVFFFVFFEYGLPYLARFSEALSGFREEEANEITEDNIPPSPPQIKALPEATNSANLVVEGQAEAKSELTLYLNGDEIKKTIVDEGQEFSLSDIELVMGDNYIFATAEDLAGNVSQESTRQTITLDKEVPELEVSSPENGKEFEEDEITVKGKTEDNAVVTVNERQVVVDLEGNFEASYSLVIGANEILVIAKDKAGNTAKEELKVYYYE